MHHRPLLLVALALSSFTAAQEPAPRRVLRIAHGDAAALAGDAAATLRVGFGWFPAVAESRTVVAPLRADLARAVAPELDAPRFAVNLAPPDAARAAESFPVVTVGGVRVACLALAVTPVAGRAAWAELEAPAAALQRLWPEVLRRAELALVLADADRLECAEWLRDAPLPVVALVRARSGLDPEPLPLGTAFLVQSPRVPAVRGDLVITFAGSTPAGVEGRFAPVPPAPPTNGAGPEELLAKFLAKEPPPAAATREPDRSGTSTRGGLALRLEVHGLRTLRPKSGPSLLAVDLELTNDTDPQAAAAAKRPPRLAVPDHGFCLELDARAGVPPERAASAGPGGLLAGLLATEPLVLERPGARRRGELCFVLGDATPTALALRCRDDAGGEIRIELPVPAATATATPAPAPAPAPVADGGRAIPATPPPAPRGLAGHGIDPRAVDAAIARGAAFLWHTLRASNPKATAGHVLLGSSNELLATLALVHAREPVRDPACAAWIKTLLEHLRPSGSMQTYQAGVLAMLIDATGAPEHLPLLRMTARFLVESQGAGGSWGYGQKVADDLLLDPDRRVLQVVGGTPLDGSPRSLLACPRQSAPDAKADGDNSCTQFALLGLRAAARFDLEIPAATWRAARTAQERRQLAHGGFGYAGAASEAGSGAMTAAGICALAITAHELGLAPPADDRCLQRALAWLDQNFRIDANPAGSWNSYYRYSIERTGRILDAELLGRHEWYPLGAAHLLQSQRADGSWLDLASDPVLDTSFALLFLTRATARLHEELRTGGSGTLCTGTAVAAVGRLYLILDASGSMLEQRGGRTKFDLARDGAAALIGALPHGTEVALRVYGNTKRSVEPGADTDSTLVLPFAPLDRRRFEGTLATLRARGRTPLAFSLQEARRDLGTSDQPTTVVLLTDGGEDAQSKLDPTRAAEQLRTLKNLNFHVIAFDIDRPDWRRQLEQTALAGGGTCWQAPSGTDLGPRLLATVLRLPEEWRVLDRGGKQVARGRFGQDQALPEGHYSFVTQFAGEEHSAPFWINTEATTRILFDGSRARVQ